MESVFGLVHNHLRVGLEDLVGSAYGDLLIGGYDDNALYGGGGNDELHGVHGADLLSGQDGRDTAWYLFSASGVSVNMITGAASGGEAAGDTLSGIEDLYGSDFADLLIGGYDDNARKRPGWAALSCIGIGCYG
ncbi:MAG: hypothetical protein HOH66_07300 [Rhodospirillaceae bacterium]|nr:hypothetical protein [Rhodospirillaceae bacterium]